MINRISLSVLVALSTLFMPQASYSPVLADTVDVKNISASWLNDRILDSVNVDPGGIIISLKTGEKVRRVNMRPLHRIKAAGLDGSLCTGQSCQGSAPASIELFLVPSQPYENQIKNPDSSSLVSISTNAGNVYQFKVRPNKATARRYNITK